MTTGITLGDLSGFDSTEKAYPALVGRNMGHQTLKLNLSHPGSYRPHKGLQRENSG